MPSQSSSSSSKIKSRKLVQSCPIQLCPVPCNKQNFKNCVPNLLLKLSNKSFGCLLLAFASHSNASASNDSTPTQAICEETCSGEMYLKPRFIGSGNVPDFDDLADFVECKKGKDYSGWLKDRDRFRKRKITKRAQRMWDKKKQAWRSMRGNN